MKQQIIGILSLLALFGCRQPSSYTINGSIRDHYDGAVVVLQHDSMGVFIDMDSTRVNDGTFSFSGKENTPKVARITLTSPLIDSSTVEPILFVLENASYHIHLDTLSVVTGNSLSENLSLYLQKKRRFELKMQHINNVYMHHYIGNTLNSDSFTLLRHSFTAIEEEFKEMTRHYIKANYDNTIGTYLFNHLGYLFTLKEMQNIIENSPLSFRKNPIVHRTQETLATMTPIVVGNPFENFTMQTAQGAQVELSKWAGKGKYVVLYVWASWCQNSPEIISIVNEIAQQAKYKKNIYIGISMDTQYINWKNSITKEKPAGLQVSDLRGWNSPFSAIYNIDKIPCYILINPSGIVIAEGNDYTSLPQIIQEKIQQ